MRKFKRGSSRRRGRKSRRRGGSFKTPSYGKSKSLRIGYRM